MRKGKENVGGYITKQFRDNHKPDFKKLHYQQVTTIDRYGKPKTVMAWVDNSN